MKLWQSHDGTVQSTIVLTIVMVSNSILISADNGSESQMVIFCAGFEIRPLLNPVKEQLEISQYSDEKCLFRAKKVLSLTLRSNSCSAMLASEALNFEVFS
ncbi:hypothetical protein [Nostoc sp.]|uniref:hypothetical protein n=1 Tax=Nostoc sp. TaxID=1180 RepID=UPI002FFD3809